MLAGYAGLRSRRLQVRALPGILVLTVKGLTTRSQCGESLLFWIELRRKGPKLYEFAGGLSLAPFAETCAMLALH